MWPITLMILFMFNDCFQGPVKADLQSLASACNLNRNLICHPLVFPMEILQFFSLKSEKKSMSYHSLFELRYGFLSCKLWYFPSDGTIQSSSTELQAWCIRCSQLNFLSHYLSEHQQPPSLAWGLHWPSGSISQPLAFVWRMLNAPPGMLWLLACYSFMSIYPQ